MEAEKGVLDKKASKNEVVLQIPETEDAFNMKKEPQMDSSTQRLRYTVSPSPEIKNLTPKPTKPPKFRQRQLIKRRLLSKLEFSKPKSRLVEPPCPTDPNLIEGKTQMMSSKTSNRNFPNVASPNNRIIARVTPKTPLIGIAGEDEDDDEEVYKTADIEVSKRSAKKKWKLTSLIEWVAFVCIMGALISSLTIHKLQNSVIWSLKQWKWCVLVLVILCGRVITEWFMNILVFLFERNFLFKRKVLCFVYGLKKSVQAFIWLALVLLTWFLLFNHGVKRSKRTRRILNYINRALASCLIGAAVWLVKTLLLIKLLASSFQCTRFFDRIQESIFHQYILLILLRPPLIEMAEMVGKTASTGQLSFRTLNRGKEGETEEVIDVEKPKKMKQDKVSDWTMKGLINVIRSSGLSTISDSLESFKEEEGEQKDKEITSEWEAKAAAYRIFKNVAKP